MKLYLCPEINVIRYSSELESSWDNFVACAENSTFLFFRKYIDYCEDQFQDHSLLLYYKGELAAVFPANYDGAKITSHSRLTYGGVIWAKGLKLTKLLPLFYSVLAYYKESGFKELVYKRMPRYYFSESMDADEYPLFLCGAKLFRRDPSFVVSPSPHFKLEPGRSSELNRAQKVELIVEESQDWDVFWNQVLEPNLRDRFGIKPVHSLDEIILLKNRFPQNIRLFVTKVNEVVTGGVVIYVVKDVAHIQYSATNQQGKAINSQIFLINHLITKTFSNFRYLNFGTSSEEEGRVLNLGLTRWKEKFNPRLFSHDFYRVDLNSEFIDLKRNLSKDLDPKSPRNFTEAICAPLTAP